MRTPYKTSAFLSTLPVRGATRAAEKFRSIALISIHAPREGSDLQYAVLLDRARQFLSTLPVRGATVYVLQP